MGQNSSRLRRSRNDAATQTNTITNAAAGASTDTQSDRTAVPVETAGPQRSSVRRSILNLVKPRSRVNSAATHPENARRSWRRWSKAPPLDFNPSLPESSTDLSSSPTAGPSTPRSENGKQPERPEADGESLEGRGWPDDSGEAPSGSTLTAAGEEGNGEGEEVVIAPEEIVTSNEVEPATTTTTSDDPPPPTISPTTAQQPTTPARQQFPPPGTLVVVQGIVHTTDVSRTPTQPADSNNSLVPPPTNLTNTERSSSRTRNRLSALLRPSATSSGPSDSPTPSTPESGSSVDTALTTPDVNEPADSSASAPRPATTDSDLDRVPTISSSSIDVLGTLLSVAAAATAASLLTGSSEPILSSGLAPPGTAPTNSNSPSNLSSRPTSPTPDGALGLGLGNDTRAERMRQAWGTIRERLGLRPNPPSTSTPTTPAVEDAPVAPGDQPPTPAVPTDTRELMLAEMARAFNVGLGLNGLGGVVPGAGDGETAANATGAGDAQEPAPLPAEGSFERFLFDLQADLRNALTHVDGQGSQDNNQEDEEDGEEDTRGSSNSSSNDEHREMPPLMPLASTSLESVVRTTASGSRFLSGDGESSSNPIPAVMSGESIRLTSDTPRELDEDDGSGMPDLQDVSDTESESDDDDEETDEESDDYPPQNPASTSNTEQPPPNASPTSMGSGRIDAEGRINWWRLYRFPPIVSPRAVAVTAAADLATGSRHPYSTADSNPDTQPSAPPTTTIRPPSVNSSSDTTSSSASSSQENPQQSNNIVVPVIVVGLQSVNAPWRPDGLPSDHDGHTGDHDGHAHAHGASTRGGMDTSEPPAASGSSEPESPDDDDFDGFGNTNNQHPQNPPPNTTGGPRENRRSRGWQSRAAAAIRNLRPGSSRRNSSNGNGEGQQPAIGGPGSRTFLIYVIGGYYPPDHSIVTGGPNNMESFEALLELADLLGQTKPPTASKEEIDNSGLEIIKPAQLLTREKDGRVASNCIERCLICLDEYQAEEDIRVMTCRHAFHRNCVDKWLQTGRNNCPACRTLGVSTEGTPIHTPPATPGA